MVIGSGVGECSWSLNLNAMEDWQSGNAAPWKGVTCHGDVVSLITFSGHKLNLGILVGIDRPARGAITFGNSRPRTCPNT